MEYKYIIVIYVDNNLAGTEVGLMNDRLGNMSTGIDDGNIRYYGASPNNYIYFNCDDYSDQTSTIGIKDNTRKMISETTYPL